MKQMIDMSLICVIAFALLGSMFYMLLTFDKNDKVIQFASMLTKNQQKIYRNILRKD